MGLRREIRSLSRDERRAFVEALLSLKKSGRYDQYVHWHHSVMIPTLLPTEPPNPDYRNGAQARAVISAMASGDVAASGSRPSEDQFCDHNTALELDDRRGDAGSKAITYLESRLHGR